MASLVADAIHRSAKSILSEQDDDGHWEDFELPVGASDAWVTAYAASALAEAGQVLADSDAWEASRRAAEWLTHDRAYAVGWGFNSRTGPDADSTAYTLSVLRHHGTPPQHDIDWLREHWHSDGGFSTYQADDAWGKPHPCVTPLAFLALPAPYRDSLSPALLSYQRRLRRSDGAWPAYWWRTCHYSTFWNLLVWKSLQSELHHDPYPRVCGPSREIHGAFDLAWVLGINWLNLGPCNLTDQLTHELLKRQRHGRWTGAPNLRVTHHDCLEPWADSRGACYPDVRGLLTTASVLRVLCLVEAGLR